MSRVLSILILITCLTLKLNAAPGDWEQFLSMKNTFKVVEGNGKIYFASDGGLFYYNLADYSIETLSKIDGLSELSIRTIGYNKANSVLVVVYESSMIDLVYDNGTIFPIGDIKRKNIQGDNSVHNLQQAGDLCYLACGFGIVVLNVRKQEIKDTYLIGSGGGYLSINDVAIFDGNLYAATPEGLKYASLEDNLLDFSNWNTIYDNAGLPYQEYWLVEATDSALFCIDRNGENNYGGAVYQLKENGLWSRFWIDTYAFREFEIKNNKVVVPGLYQTSVLNIADRDIKRVPKYQFLDDDEIMLPRSAIEDSYGNIWIADYQNGGVKFDNRIATEIVPDGPLDNYVFRLNYSSEKLWVTRGAFDDVRSNRWLQPLIQSYSVAGWETFDRSTFPEWDKRFDASIVVGVPKSPNHIMVSLWGSGIFEIKNGQIINFFNADNSPLESIIPGENYIRIEGMTYDDEGNLWVTNGKVENNLHCYTADSTWETYYLNGIANDFSVGKVIYTRDDNLWMIVNNSSRGLYVVSHDGVSQKSLNVQSYFANGVDEVITSMNDVKDIVEDLDGEIWVATTMGIITYSAPYSVFDQNPFYGYRPGLDLNDGIYHPLLGTETVTCLAVDGANRKYCGTEDAGLFLISADGEKEIANYNTENSPLLSNNITSLAYDGKSGKLYIGTSGGLVALTTDSKTGATSFEEIYAYPNPVRENYEGDIYITGLMENTTVKITTVSGKLVYQTTSYGGQAVWPGTDLNGKRVHTGVYLAFCSANDGEDSAVTKILFIR